MISTCRCRRPRRFLLSLLALAGLGLAGCGPSKFYPVRGKVIFEDTNKPLTEGEVRFRPVANPGLIASGKIGPNGEFTLSTPGHGDAVLEGGCEAVVLVEPRDGKPVLDPRYEDFSTSKLPFTVAPRDENYFVFSVHPAPK